jgi:hypothetical protein
MNSTRLSAVALTFAACVMVACILIATGEHEYD